MNGKTFPGAIRLQRTLRAVLQRAQKEKTRGKSGLVFLLGLLIALLPALILLHRDRREGKQAFEKELTDETLALARLGARDYDRLFAATRRTLAGLSKIKDVQKESAASFARATAPLLAHHPHLRDFRWMTADGRYVTSEGTVRSVDLMDLPGFKDSLSHGKFFVGLWKFERFAQRPTVYAAHPVPAVGNAPPGALLAIFKVSALDEISLDLGLPEGHDLLLLDPDNRVLASDSPNRLTPGIPAPEAFQWVGTSLRPHAHPFVVQKDRVMAWADVNPSLVPGWRVVLSLPRSLAGQVTDHRWLINFGLLLLSLGSVFLIGSIGGTYRSNRFVAPFLEVATHWREGDFNARVRAGQLPKAHQHWALAFNQLAEVFGQKEKESQELRTAYDKRLAEKSDETLSVHRQWEAFTQAVSQNLRAPLRAIDGFTLILLNEHAAGLTPEGRHFLDIVVKNTKHLSRFVEELAIFSQTVRKEAFPSRVDMAEMAQEVFQVLLAEEPNRRVRLEMEDLPPAKADPSMVRQLWTNFFENALKFTSQHPNPVIRVGGTLGPGQNTYWIKDNGVGFNPQHADRLFHVFQRLHASSEFEGSGVGLAIIQRIVEKHNGRLWAESRPGEGASFFFCLPSATDPSIGETTP